MWRIRLLLCAVTDSFSTNVWVLSLITKWPSLSWVWVSLLQLSYSMGRLIRTIFMRVFAIMEVRTQQSIILNVNCLEYNNCAWFVFGKCLQWHLHSLKLWETPIFLHEIKVPLIVDYAKLHQYTLYLMKLLTRCHRLQGEPQACTFFGTLLCSIHRRWFVYCVVYM
jgi:hypothetical protein